MSVFCGTDFSESADVAARVAAGIAARLGLPLELVHVHETELPESPGGLWPERSQVERRLSEQALALQSVFGAEVTPSLEQGAPHEVLARRGQRADARLIVVGSLGKTRQELWLLGSVAERVVQAASVPVLVVREAAGLEAWLRGEKTLRILVGVECTALSRTALAWANALRRIGPADLIVARIAWPAEEHDRFGVSTPVPLDHLRPELEAPLVRELEAWAGEEGRGAPGSTTFVVRAGWGRVDGHLTQVASETGADLLVVGTHQRAGIARLWQGSVSRGVLHCAAMSVACIPQSKGSRA